MQNPAITRDHTEQPPLTFDLTRRPFGFNVIGYVSSNSGLGVSARQITKLLLDKSCPIAILDIEPGQGRGRHDLSFDSYTVKTPEDLPYALNLAVLAAPSLPSFFLHPPTILGSDDVLQPGSNYWLADDRLNVAFVWWELAVLPEIWITALEAFDIVVAASPFIRSTLETHLSNVLTIPALHPFSIPPGIEASRVRFGLPSDVILFVMSFEPMSDPERKNPFGVIHAFQRAFPNDARANLVIKLNNAQGTNDTLVPTLTKLRGLCNADRRIRIIDEVLSYSDVLCLYASCDVFVSLHRSEGYGFGLLEAMALGKPVIATAWSGNMAFMSHANSCLVRYKLIPVNANLRVYSRASLGTTATWADPDLDEAASWMRKLVEDPGYRTSLGHRAAMDTIDLQREAQKGKFVDEIRAVWQNYAFLPRPGRNEKIAALNVIRRTWQEQASTLPRRKRLSRSVRRALEQHVLWRLRRS